MVSLQDCIDIFLASRGLRSIYPGCLLPNGTIQVLARAWFGTSRWCGHCNRAMYSSEGLEPFHQTISADLFGLLDKDNSRQLLVRYTHAANTLCAMSIWSIVLASVTRLGSRDSLQELKTLLLFSSALLVSGVLFTHSWMSWPLEFLAVESADAIRYRQVVTWLTTHVAVVYAVMLTSFFGPVLLLAAGRLRGTTTGPANPETSSPALQTTEPSTGDPLEYDLPGTHRELSWTSIMAMLAPALVQIVLEVLKMVRSVGNG